jgi:hypothetical protein
VQYVETSVVQLAHPVGHILVRALVYQHDAGGPGIAGGYGLK